MTTYAVNTHAGDGATVAFAVSFDFIRRSDVTVTRITDSTKYEKKLKVIESGTPTGNEYVWNNDNQITVGKAPTADQTLKIQRDTPENAQIVDWQDGSYIVAEDLNTSDEQWLFNIQELYDGLTALDGAVSGEAVKSISGTAPVQIDDTNDQIPVISVDETVSTDDPNSLTSDTKLMSEKAIDDHFKQYVGTGPSSVNKVGQLRIDNTSSPQATYWWNGTAWVALTTEGAKGDPGPAGPPPGLQDPASTVTNIPLKGNGDPGDATVVISQDAKKDLQFQFGIPVGKTGETGAPGPKGDAGDGVTYKGPIDATTAPEPTNPKNGDFYVNTVAGTSTWTGLGTVADGSRLVWNKETSQWDGYTPTYATDLGYIPAADGGTITNTNGANASLPVVDSTNAGLMTPAMLTNLNPSLDDVLQVGNTSETSIVIGKDGNNTTIGQGDIEATGSVNVGDHVRFAGTNDGGQPRLVDIQAPTNNADFAANYTLTWPPALGSAGQVLRTDATGKLSWDGTVQRFNSAYVASQGDAGSPAHTFSGKKNAGMYFSDTNKVNIATNGTRRATFGSGLFECPGIYNNTDPDGAAVVVDTSGRLRRKGSSRAYKTNIEPIEYSYAENILNNAQPVYYKPKVQDPEYPQAYLDLIDEQIAAGEADIHPSVYQCMEFCAENNIPWTMDEKWMNEGANPDHSHWGFIAEDLAEIDPRLCSYNPHLQRYDGVHYSEFAPILLSICQKQRDQIKSLEERLDALEKSAS